MVGINGIGLTPEPANGTRGPAREPRTDFSGAWAVKDNVAISKEAQQASEAARALGASKTQSQYRAERVAEAKAKLEQGTYRIQEVVKLVASRVAVYVGDEA